MPELADRLAFLDSGDCHLVPARHAIRDRARDALPLVYGGLLGVGAGAVAAWTELGPFWGGITGGASVVVAVVMLFWLPKSRAGRQMVLEHNFAEAVSQEDRRALVGRRGITGS